jgi:hypothetical protein
VVVAGGATPGLPGALGKVVDGAEGSSADGWKDVVGVDLTAGSGCEGHRRGGDAALGARGRDQQVDAIAVVPDRAVSRLVGWLTKYPTRTTRPLCLVGRDGVPDQTVEHEPRHWSVQCIDGQDEARQFGHGVGRTGPPCSVEQGVGRTGRLQV